MQDNRTLSWEVMIDYEQDIDFPNNGKWNVCPFLYLPVV